MQLSGNKSFVDWQLGIACKKLLHCPQWLVLSLFSKIHGAGFVTRPATMFVIQVTSSLYLDNGGIQILSGERVSRHNQVLGSVSVLPIFHAANIWGRLAGVGKGPNLALVCSALAW